MPKKPATKKKTVSLRFVSKKKLVQKRSVNKNLPGVFTLVKRTFEQIKLNKKLFIGITLVYIFLLLIFVWSGGGLINASKTKRGCRICDKASKKYSREKAKLNG